MAGRVSLAAVVVGAFYLGVPTASAAKPTDKTLYLMSLQSDLERSESELAAARKKKGQEFLVDYYRLDIKIIKEQLANAKESLANGEEYGQKEYLQAIKDRSKAHQDETARDRQESDKEYKQAMANAEAERQADTEKAEREFAKATGQAMNQYQTQVGAEELLRKFRTSNGELRLVIWNLPLDGSLGKRSARIVNVALMAGKQVAWKQTNLKLDRRQASTEVRLPQVMFDQVVVEVAKWDGDGGGLAEVEVYVGTENVALHRPCQVSSLETLPAHLDDQDAVTDGVTMPTENGVGYWLPEAKKKASVRIDLLGPIKKDAKDAAPNRATPIGVR